MSIQNPVMKTAPRTVGGQNQQSVTDQNAVFLDAYQKGIINKEQYDAAMVFQKGQMAEARTAPTGPAPTVIQTDQRTDQYLASMEFYNSIGHPEYGGLYAVPDIPEGFQVTNVTKDADGQLNFEIYGQSTDNNALDMAINADMTRKAFMLGANTRQGTSPTGPSLALITSNLSPEDKAAFNEYQKKEVTASMVNLGLTFAVAAAPIVAPAVGVAATTIVAGEVASVAIAQGVKLAEGGGALTLDEALVNAGVGAALAGTGSVANSALKITGAGAKLAAARVGVNAVIGAGANAGVEYATTGQVTLENVALGAGLGAGIGVAAEGAGAAFNALKGAKSKGGMSTDPYSTGGKGLKTETIVAREAQPIETPDMVNAKIDNMGFNKDVVNTKINRQLQDANAFDSGLVDSKISNVLKEAELWKAQNKTPTTSKPSEFITDIGTSKGGMSTKGGDYLITQPQMRNLEISKGLNLKNPNTFNPEQANARITEMIGGQGKGGYGSDNLNPYRSILSQGLTATKTKTGVRIPSLSGRTGFNLPTATASAPVVLGGALNVPIAPITEETTNPVTASPTTGLIGKMDTSMGMNNVNRKMGIQNTGLDFGTASFLENVTAPINIDDVNAKIDQQLGGGQTNTGSTEETTLGNGGTDLLSGGSGSGKQDTFEIPTSAPAPIVLPTQGESTQNLTVPDLPTDTDLGPTTETPTKTEPTIDIGEDTGIGESTDIGIGTDTASSMASALDVRQETSVNNAYSSLTRSSTRVRARDVKVGGFSLSEFSKIGKRKKSGVWKQSRVYPIFTPMQFATAKLPKNQFKGNPLGKLPKGAGPLAISSPRGMGMTTPKLPKNFGGGGVPKNFGGVNLGKQGFKSSQLNMGSGLNYGKRKR